MNTPIKRSIKFFGEEDFDLEQDFASEFMGDMNMTIILYKVDHLNTPKNIYNEAKTNSIIFLPPLELQCVVRFDEPKNTSLVNKGVERYLDKGNITVNMLNRVLEELNTDINYGDYLAYQDGSDSYRYYTVSDDGRLNFDGKHTQFGYKSAFRTIKGTSVTDTEFNLNFNTL